MLITGFDAFLAVRQTGIVDAVDHHRHGAGAHGLDVLSARRQSWLAKVGLLDVVVADQSGVL